jgi:hypothetical protein
MKKILSLALSVALFATVAFAQEAKKKSEACPMQTPCCTNDMSTCKTATGKTSKIQKKEKSSVAKAYKASSDKKSEKKS